ncbi:23S rRNA pseudouridine synthase F [Tumebacillus algifaecis]|uniref:Pseudouridine synthase n=1 Tax=Tumebacillus algifaecis TaxID=1214604 RepID=A0A223CX41_9BACL|nr:23S rRNA pseudouridine(2604) synthase RluF [Tumebacillus algifaecis]ASS73713.1 23S rRNA pseudouridine synthase F [Tumebacillus algifaecis]
MRINKYISSTGLCSRREADKLIEERRVTINGDVAVMGSTVEYEDVVRVDGEQIGSGGGERRKRRKTVYIMLNKPVGIISTTEMKVQGNIVDFVNHQDRVFPIGRLDKDSEGLILLTNDGDIVNRILRAENNHEKEYVVTLNKPYTKDFMKSMASGVDILDTTTKPAKLFPVSENTFRIILTQGLNRQIRRMCEALGYRVRTLKRIRVMNIRLEGLKLGHWRNLTHKELSQLLEMLDEE